MKSAERLAAAVAVATPVLDIVEERAVDERVPSWCQKRGWTSFLLSLSDAELGFAESNGLAAALPALPRAPGDLVELAGAITAVCQLPRFTGATPLADGELRSVRLRKRAQLSSLLSAVGSMAAVAERLVDVGAGSGHFTRLSAEHFGREAIGLERDAARVTSARERSSGTRARFVTLDARQGIPLSERDLAIGLHACGELGDGLVRAAAGARCDLALVSCCLQKISAPARLPLALGPALRREHLGLTNLTAGARGVETSLEVTLAARETRFALGLLLRGRGLALEPGAEMMGINRRRAQSGLSELAERALRLRNLDPPSASELQHYRAEAAEHFAKIRRISLPRSMLARLIEVLVSLDRAAHLESQALEVRVLSLFDRAISPRNIGIFASRESQRLPAA